MFISPFKFRQLNLKFILFPFVSFHLIVIILFCTLLIRAPIARLLTVQEYLTGMPLKIFDACVMEDEEDFFVGSFYNLIQ